MVLNEQQVAEIEEYMQLGCLASMDATYARYQRLAEYVPNLVETLHAERNLNEELIKAKARWADKCEELQSENAKLQARLKQREEEFWKDYRQPQYFKTDTAPKFNLTSDK